MDNKEFLEDLKVELDSLKRLGDEMKELIGRIKNYTAPQKDWTLKV